ncbi:MAG: histidine phosphatase family protein [Planctomycetota bacterium]
MAKTKDFRILLVRSGRNDWDLAGRVTGVSDLPLCTEGKEDAEALRQYVGDEKLTAILTAPDEASKQTAEIIARVGASKPKMKRIDDLIDVDMGLWEGLLAGDLEERYPKAYKAWLENPASVSVPDGEGFADAEARVLDQLARALSKLSAKSEHPAVGVVVRPLIFGIMRSKLLGEPSSKIWSLANDERGYEWHVVDTERLEGLTRKLAAAGKA